MTAVPDGLDPPGEQLGLFPDPGLVETITHRGRILADGPARRWVCACGQEGTWTTHRAARGGLTRHLRAAAKRAAQRPDKP